MLPRARQQLGGERARRGEASAAARVRLEAALAQLAEAEAETTAAAQVENVLYPSLGLTLTSTPYPSNIITLTVHRRRHSRWSGWPLVESLAWWPLRRHGGRSAAPRAPTATMIVPPQRTVATGGNS